MQLTKQILKLMRRRDYRPSTANEIAASLAAGFRPDQVSDALRLLEEERRIIKTSKSRYAIPVELDLVMGEFEANRAGYGFVESPAGDLYIPRSRVHGAMHGDTVAVRLLRQRRGLSNEAEVVRVVDRAHETVIGRVEKRGRVTVVVPSDRRIFYELLIAREREKGAADGDMVVARFTVYPDGRAGAHAEIVEILGGEDSPTIEIDVIVKEHGFSADFPPEALAEAGRIPDEVSPSEAGRRRDFRDLFTVTIDGLDAQDFDDAVSLSKEDDDYRLAVHIADVSHYVRPGSAVDAEAHNRGTSVYLSDRVLPMLPERLSNGICSLNPMVDRLSLSVEMVVDRAGHIKRFEISEGVIRSDYRLTYEEVDEMFKSDSYPGDPVRELLTGLRELSDVLEVNRLDRGALDFETIEPKVILDEKLTPVEVVVREKTPATKLIEETMILTNETIASFMYWQEAPMVYRVHDKPSLESLTQIEELVSTFGYPVKKVKAGSSRELQKIISYAHSRPERLTVNHLLLRSMKRAKYHPASSPHFGLASEQYTHFTSPIRRYPDLIVHRLVKAALAGDIFDSTIVEIADSLGEICEHSSWMEREADEAERESVDVKLCQLMAGRIGEVFAGTISGVTPFGVFVQLANTAEGLIHIRDLPGYFDYNERLFELENRKTGQVFRIGQEVKVQLTNVLVGERRIDFVLGE
ncbi:MAG: ribonuclease R [Actinobacteria bacterium]|nr:ribonuclease R [Chloroflexota bacterium]MCL5291421.1 ribonuclease R [Actinomycetota bacterium]